MVEAAPAPAGQHQQTMARGAKDVVTTALSGHVWATVGDGIVNEVFWPAADQPQVKDLGFLVRAAGGEPGEWVEVKAQSHYTVEPIPTCPSRWPSSATPAPSTSSLCSPYPTPRVPRCSSHTG